MCEVFNEQCNWNVFLFANNLSDGLAKRQRTDVKAQHSTLATPLKH